MTKLDIITKARRALKISKKRKEDHVLLLRTCSGSLRAYGGFQWLEAGKLVEAPDWNPEPVCGGGLHGALWGVGDGSLLSFYSISKWMVVAARSDDVVDLDGKVKVPKAFVCFVGSQLEATNWLVTNSNVDMTTKPIIGLHRTAKRDLPAIVGFRGVAIAGNYGNAIAGDRGTATTGEGGEATAGNCGNAIAGISGIAIVGDSGTATSGNYGRSAAGDSGVAIVGSWGTAIAGFNGKAVAGYSGKAIVGNYGVATTGRYGDAAAGDFGIIRIEWYESNRPRWVIGYVGENDIEANVVYKATIDGKLVAVK